MPGTFALTMDVEVKVYTGCRMWLHPAYWVLHAALWLTLGRPGRIPLIWKHRVGGGVWEWAAWYADGQALILKDGVR